MTPFRYRRTGMGAFWINLEMILQPLMLMDIKLGGFAAKEGQVA